MAVHIELHPSDDGCLFVLVDPNDRISVPQGPLSTIAFANSLTTEGCYGCAHRQLRRIPNMNDQTQVGPRLRVPPSADFPSGPEIGERLPDITLQDQHGNYVNVEQARGNRRALVLFHRSLHW